MKRSSPFEVAKAQLPLWRIRVWLDDDTWIRPSKQSRANYYLYNSCYYFKNYCQRAANTRAWVSGERAEIQLFRFLSRQSGILLYPSEATKSQRKFISLPLVSFTNETASAGVEWGILYISTLTQIN